jgi:predicted metalloprotease with PDZ domain
MKVYWSGAALALMADVQLRERSGGSKTLDSVLQRLQACCLPSPDVWTGPEFFTKLDSLIDEPVFMPLYRRYADTAGFPDTSEVFERLGLRVSDNKVSIRRKAELGDIRATITAMNQLAARRRGRLAAAD